MEEGWEGDLGVGEGWKGDLHGGGGKVGKEFWGWGEGNQVLDVFKLA